MHRLDVPDLARRDELLNLPVGGVVSVVEQDCAGSALRGHVPLVPVRRKQQRASWPALELGPTLNGTLGLVNRLEDALALLHVA